MPDEFRHTPADREVNDRFTGPHGDRVRVTADVQAGTVDIDSYDDTCATLTFWSPDQARAIAQSLIDAAAQVEREGDR